MDERKAECQGCGLSPNVRSGDVVIWCDECYSELRHLLIDCVVHFRCIEIDLDAKDETPSHYGRFLRRLQKAIDSGVESTKRPSDD